MAKMARDNTWNDEETVRKSGKMSTPEKSVVRTEQGRESTKNRAATKRASPASADLRGNMGKAVSILEEQTERGKHAAVVGGHKMTGHSGMLPDADDY
jgi:hypothetical protein